MKCCTFFGHRNCPAGIRPSRRAAILAMVGQQGVDTFYVGHQGAFDRMAFSVLRELDLPNIRYAVVLAYLPAGSSRLDPEIAPHSFFPDGMESVPQKFAIARRNDWLLRHADCVITYVCGPGGGAAKYAAAARRQGKQIIDLA